MKSLLVSILCVAGYASASAQSMTMGELFDAGKYAEAIQEAERAYQQGEKEAALYVATASSCLGGEYEKAIGFARRYLKENPKGNFQTEIAYYYGVSLARLGYKERAEFILSQLQSIPDTKFRQLALYELALLHFHAADYLNAISRSEALLSEDLWGALRIQTELVLGQALEARREREMAEQHYLSAHALAESEGNHDLLEECLFHLVAFYGREKIQGVPNAEMAKALPYYELYIKQFAESEYQLQVLAAVLPALVEDGRLDEGIEKLEASVQWACENGKEAGLQDAASSLLWAKIDAGATLSELRQHYLSESGEVGAVLTAALADIYEIGAEQSHLSWGKQMKLRTIARDLRCRLLERDGEVYVPAFVQYDLGELLLESERDPVAAQMHFERAEDTNAASLQLWVRLGVGLALEQQGGDQFTQSLAIFKDLELRAAGDVELLDITLLAQIRVLASLGKWEQVEVKSRQYLGSERLKKNRTQAIYYLARSFDERGAVEEAIANYTQIFTSATGELPVSAPSVQRLTELTWERNMPAKGANLSDRQIAYQLAQRYLALIEGLPEWKEELGSVASHLSGIRGNVKLWEQSGEVESVEEILEQMRKGERPIIRKQL